MTPTSSPSMKPSSDPSNGPSKQPTSSLSSRKLLDNRFLLVDPTIELQVLILVNGPYGARTIVDGFQENRERFKELLGDGQRLGSIEIVLPKAKETPERDTPAVRSGAGRKATSFFLSSAAVSSAVAAIVGFAF